MVVGAGNGLQKGVVGQPTQIAPLGPLHQAQAIQLIRLA